MKKVYGWLVGILLAAMVCGAVSAFAEESGAQAGFVNNVQVLQEIRNEAQWQALPESDVDIALVKIDGDGKLSVGNEKADFRLSSFGNAIPALYVSDEAAAAAAVTVLTESAPCAGEERARVLYDRQRHRGLPRKERDGRRDPGGGQRQCG